MTTIKFRRDTSTNWTQANPIPAQGEPCYETDTGKLKIGNGSDYYSNLPYVSDGGTAGGTTDYTELENKPQINSVELSGNKTLDDLGIQAKGDYLSTKGMATSKSAYSPTGVWLDSGTLKTIAPVFTGTSDGLDIKYEYPLKAAVYAATEPDNDDMVTAWTNIDGFFTDGFDDATGCIYGSVKFYAGEGSVSVIYKMMDSNRIASISQTGTSKFSKVEISSDGSTYDEVTSYPTSYCRYIRFTFEYSYSTTTYAEFKTKICTYGSASIGGQAFKQLGVNVDDSTIKVVDNKLVANVPTKTSELTNDSGFLTEAPDNMVTTDTAQTITGSKTFSSATVSSTLYLGNSLTFNGTNTTINSINDIYGGWQSGSNLSLTNNATLTGNTGLKVQTYSGDIAIGGNNSSGVIKIANGSETVNITSGSGGIFLNGGDGAISIYSDTTLRSGKKMTLNNITNNKSVSLGSSSYGGLNIKSTSTESEFIYMYNSTNSSLSIGRTGISIIDNVDDVTRTFIDTSNIDTTYMKWSSDKLSVDTAAVAHLAMPSTTTVILTLGASGTTYTAPADGYISLNTSSTFTGWIKVDSVAGNGANASSQQFRTSSPVFSGEAPKIWYDFSSGSTANIELTFVYLQGNVPSS